MTARSDRIFVDFDLVRALRAVTTDEGDGVTIGTRGTVVAIYLDGSAYEIVFAVGLVTVEAARLVPAPA